MSDKNPREPTDDSIFDDDDLFDQEFLDDEDLSVRSTKASGNEYDDEGLFDALLDDDDDADDDDDEHDSVRVASPAAVPKAAEFEDDHTEVIIDDPNDSVLPNTYFTDEKGRVFNVKRTPFLIGRAKECDLVVNAKGVSRRHAELTYGAGHFVLRDLDSLNGTRVNGTPVPQLRLNDADVVQLGRYRFSFFTDTSNGQSARRNGQPMREQGGASALKRLSEIQVGQVEPSAETTKSGSDWLVKLNFILVAFIIAVAVAYVIWDDLAGEEFDEQVQTEEDARRAIDLDNNDWTTPGAQPGVTDVESIVKDVELDLAREVPGNSVLRPGQNGQAGQNERPSTNSQGNRNSNQNSNRNNDQNNNQNNNQNSTANRDTNRNNANSNNGRNDTSTAGAAGDKARSTDAERDRAEARQNDDAVQARAEQEQNQARELLSSITTAYISGNNFSARLKEMRDLSDSRLLGNRLQRDLRSTYQIYENLRSTYQQGKNLFDEGENDAAFDAWQALLTGERSVLSRTAGPSYYATKIGEFASESTIDRARQAETDGDLAEATALYKKLIRLKPDGPYRADLERINSQLKAKFAEAEKLMQQAPNQAVQLLQDVIDATPRSDPLHIRAESQIIWLREGLESRR